MHEISFAKNIINQIEKKEKVKKIELEVGELAELTTEEIKTAIKNLKDWDVAIQKKDSKVKCSCGYEGPAKIIERQHDIVIFECPNCGNIPKILEGDKIKIKKVIYY